MADAPELEQTAFSGEIRTDARNSRDFGRQNLASGFLSYLVFEGHGVRIGLEITSCVLCYTAAAAVIPWTLLGVPARWAGLVAWFGSCALVLFFDQCVLCRPAHALRSAYLLTLGGCYDQALAILEIIGPRGRAAAKLPERLYHLSRAEIFVLARRFRKAEQELIAAEGAGAAPDRLSVLRSWLLRMQGEFGAAEQELEAAARRAPASPVIRFEQGRLFLEKGENWWEAKRLFKSVLELPESAHYAGDTTHQLARAYWNACRLRTGEAEEGLEELNWCIERLRSVVNYVDTLRPIIAQLLLERAAYYAGHKEPAGAIIDLKTALLYCTYPGMLQKAEWIKSELSWRYPTPLTW